MKKPIQDLDDCVAFFKPLRIPSYRPSALPDAKTANCLIVINDPSDNDPRGCLAVSNGSSWDRITWPDDAQDKGRQSVTHLQPHALEIIQPAPQQIKLIGSAQSDTLMADAERDAKLDQHDKEWHRQQKVNQTLATELVKSNERIATLEKILRALGSDAQARLENMKRPAA